MSIQKCRRCGRQEHIPTHQFVKFDDQLHDLCGSCWNAFRQWFHADARREDPQPAAV